MPPDRERRERGSTNVERAAPARRPAIPSSDGRPNVLAIHVARQDWSSVASGAFRFDQQVASHFQVQRRTELGAIHREYAGGIGYERHVLVLAWLEAEVDVVHVDGEAVRGVFRGLQIRD